MAKKGARILIALVCSQCNSQNYITEKNKVNRPEKLVLKKWCKYCRQKTEHKESRKLK
jgi:large subunit ribosomal protein L33